MKKIIIALLMVFTSAAHAFAGNEDVDQKLVKAFKGEFAGAQDVAWTERSNFYQVSFTYEGKKLFAFYSKSRNLLCVVHYILSTELPAYLQAELKNFYSNYWIADLFELTNEEGTSYYVTLQNADSKILLESKDQNGWETFRKFKNL